MTRKYSIRCESWPLERPFSIARGTKTHALVIVVEVQEGAAIGRGECVPYSHYGESVDSVRTELEGIRGAVERGLERNLLSQKLTAGAARNALDCALWDLEAKSSGKAVWQAAGLESPSPIRTALTVSLARPADMAKEAAAYPDGSLLKLKLDGDGVVDRVAAVRAAAPEARLIVDANESWSLAVLRESQPYLADLGVRLIEQPLPAGKDGALNRVEHLIPICADESFHTAEDLPHLAGRYDYINLKLDKCGGFTTALELQRAALQADIGLMIGCMVGTSLAMAPAALLASKSEFVDLDGPFLLREDRAPSMVMAPGWISGPEPALWG